MSGERPDLIVPKRENGTIGIEVTCYLDKNAKENLSRFQHILDEYMDTFDKEKQGSPLYKGNMCYHVRVYLHGGFAPCIYNCNSKKNQIIDELRRCLYPVEGGFFNNQYIATAEPTENVSLKASIATVSYIGTFENINEQILLKRIEDKEKKLKEYKSLPANKNIKEYYLLIFVPQIHQVNVTNCKLSSCVHFRI